MYCFTSCEMTSGFALLRSGVMRSPVHFRTFPLAMNNIGSQNREIYTITCPPTESDVLEAVVEKHVQKLDKFLSSKVIASHTQKAFDELHQMIPSLENIILDSGCGTGRSSMHLGKLFPQHTIIGVDRSIVRLTKTSHFDDDQIVHKAAENVWLVRAELIDFWRCCLQAKWNIDRHYILYPNPYPKKSRLKSRFYGHPGFPLILLLGVNNIILRSNWKTYLDEFVQSVAIADKALPGGYARPYLASSKIHVVPYLATNPKEAWTNFEQKYIQAGEDLFEVNLERSASSTAVTGKHSR